MWAADGLAVSNGGAFRIDFGIEAIGCEWRTSLWCLRSVQGQSISMLTVSYPAGVRIEEPPPYTILSNCVHSPASVEEHGQHSLSQVDDLLVLLRAGWLCCVVRHGMLLRNRWDDERRVETGQCIAEGSELGVSTSDFQILNIR